MKKQFKLFGFLLLTSFFLFFASCENPANETPGFEDQLIGEYDDEYEDESNFSYHDNYVKVNTIFNSELGNLFGGEKDKNWTITGGSFKLEVFDVSAGQDPDKHLKPGNIYTMDGNQQFCFVLGRHATKEVAATFNRACPPEHNTFNHTAGELNFWMRGTMTLKFKNGKTYTFSGTYFAQGHSGAANNWWFGHETMVNYSRPIIGYDPYDLEPVIPPIYLGKDKCGYISPDEDPNLIFMFFRGNGMQIDLKNNVSLVGVYSRAPVKW